MPAPPESCLTCGTAVEPGQEYCLECGARVVPGRRFSAVGRAYFVDLNLKFGGKNGM